MRLERLHIGGFGPLPKNRTLEFAPGLNLVLAPNERGKTTLGELVTGLFYGFGNRVGGVHPYEPWSGGDTGGELAYRLDDGGTFTLARHLDKRETTSLRDAAGRAVDLSRGRQPGELHLGLGQGAFLTVSRIRLEDLQQALYASPGETKELKATRQWLAGYFFSEAATRGQVINPVGVLQNLREQRERLYSRDRRKGAESKRLLESEAQANQSLASARERETQARQTQARLQEATTQAEALDRRRKQAAQEVERAAKQVELAQALARRGELQKQIDELTRQGLAPAEAETRARELTGQARAARERASQAEQAAAKARAQAKELSPTGEPAALEERLRGLGARRAELIAAHRHQESDERLLSSRAGALREQWGLEPSGLASLDPQMPYHLERLRTAARGAETQAEQARQAVEALPAAPAAPVLWLVLGIVALIGGAKMMFWTYMGALPLWCWALAAALALGGAGLGALWLARRSGVKQAAQKRGAAQAQADQAQEKAAQAHIELESGLEALPPGLRETQAMALSAAIGEAARLEQDRAAQDAERQRLEEQRTGLLAEARELAPEAEGGMEAALDQLAARVERAKQALSAAQGHQESAAREKASAEQLERDLAGHLAALGLADLPALTLARQREAQARDLTAKLAELDQSLGAAASGPPVEHQAAQAALATAREQAAAMEREARELATARGALERELSHLGASETVAQASARLERLAEERSVLGQEHDTLLLAEALLNRAMEEFRLEAQPGLLQKAGEYLRLATAGAYEWLGTDLFAGQGKAEPEISARAGAGSPERGSGALSRGARDQLYLCLRLALADEIVASGEPLPLILDDPLVNFDDRRLAATLQMLCKVAASRQVLLLTCHQRQADLLAGMCEVNRLEI
ncbi:MAG: AAA family ATPase [Desulfarculaceae bacterium]|nr:AAA family ATPase [Desulfarculaceae bacterium]